MGIYYDTYAVYGIKIDLSNIKTGNDYDNFIVGIEEVCSRLGLSYTSAIPYYDCGFSDIDFVVGLSVKDKTSEEVISIMAEVDEKLKEVISIMAEVDEKLKETSWTPKLYSLLNVT